MKADRIAKIAKSKGQTGDECEIELVANIYYYTIHRYNILHIIASL